jgi:uncharacterized protein YndB with AHSA1/START domain
MADPTDRIDDRLDLVLTRVVSVPRAVIWKAWTEPRHLMKWFTPAPWQTIECEIDLRPGGKFRLVMRGPDGAGHDSEGCYLQIVAGERLVWTSMLHAGYRPAGEQFLPMTAILTFEDVPGGTKYTALVLHNDEPTRQRHVEMGFEAGWGKALDQLVAIAGQIT